MTVDQPTLGPAAHHIHVIWLAAQADDPQDYYDEIDAARWTIRCIRRMRDGRLFASKYSDPDWRDVMPEAPVPLVQEINSDKQFHAREILWVEFDSLWREARMMSHGEEDPLQFNVQSSSGERLCPCCGFPQTCSRDMYGPHGGVIGSTICPACFWEPGFDDDCGASPSAKPTIIDSLLAYRLVWMGAGQPWKAIDIPAPDGWDPKTQFNALIDLAPHLRE